MENFTNGMYDVHILPIDTIIGDSYCSFEQVGDSPYNILATIKFYVEDPSQAEVIKRNLVARNVTLKMEFNYESVRFDFIVKLYTDQIKLQRRFSGERTSLVVMDDIPIEPKKIIRSNKFKKE